MPNRSRWRIQCRVWKVEAAWPRRYADGLARLKTSEYDGGGELGSYTWLAASSRTYGCERRSSSLKSGRNQSGCSCRIAIGVLGSSEANRDVFVLMLSSPKKRRPRV